MPTTTHTRGLLTVPQVCTILDVSRATFYGWRPNRGPRCVRLPNGALRVRRRDLDKWLPGVFTGLITLPEFLDELGIAESTFHDWRAKGRAPKCAKLPNGAIRITREAYEGWLAERAEVAA